MDGTRHPIGPQEGPQESFLASPADIAIYGGSAGGGKTWALLMEPLRHVSNPEFGAVFFRRSTVQIRNEGGLWDESAKLYPELGADPKQHILAWEFPGGATITFGHLEHDKTVYNWQGSQIPLICFDELTHFSEAQFWYMVSRNRSMCGVRPYVRATCNPDAASWVAEFIEWWIDQETGLPIPERGGVVRWFVRVGEALIWGDEPGDLAQYTMDDGDGGQIPIPPKSVTFIPASVTDNKALMAADPGYMANLLSLPTVERERLLGGNWKIMPGVGMFKREWFNVVETAPKCSRIMRGWDLAATDVDDNPDAAFTAGVMIGEKADGSGFVIMDAKRGQCSPNGTRVLIKGTATQDGKHVYGSIPQDPGQAGKGQVQDMIAMLAGYLYSSSPESGDKATRAGPLAAQAEAGNVDIVRGDWNKAFIDEAANFPGGKYKDQIDAAARAFNELLLKPKYEAAKVVLRL